MLPIPFRNFLPKIFRDNIDLHTDGTALANKADIHLAEWRADALEVAHFKEADRCPAKFLGELANFISADILASDAETSKRVKIFYAIERHKRRGSWESDAKHIVDSIAGGDSELVKEYYTAEWLLWGSESTDDDDYTASLGTDGVDDELGIDLIGDGDECEIAGIIWIDVDNASLTASQVQLLIDSLQDVVPAYFKVVLGYFLTGIWTVYATIN